MLAEAASVRYFSRNFPFESRDTPDERTRSVKDIALITGITSQDGFYLCEKLLDQGYEVHGLVASGTESVSLQPVSVHTCDLASGAGLPEIFAAVNPREVYHLAAQSHVGESFEAPLLTGEVTGLGTVRVLEAVRDHQQRTGQTVKFCLASSCEIFGQTESATQNEQTPISPRNPYGAAKAFAHSMTRIYREAHGLFACSAILYNHESPRRGRQFVTRKITAAAARIRLGLQESLALGNLDARRDWGFAGDYTEAMWLMLQQPEADDYVIGTGQTHSVRDFVREAFAFHGLNWEDYVQIDPRFYRPLDNHVFCADSTKAQQVLGWEPRVTFAELVRMMAAHDLAEAEQIGQPDWSKSTTSQGGK